MGIIKFLLTFFFFYFLIKFIKAAIFVNKVAKTHKENIKNFEQRASSAKKPQNQDDIIDAEYKVVDDKDK